MMIEIVLVSAARKNKECNTELGALFELYTYCFVWPIMKTLVNGAGRP